MATARHPSPLAALAAALIAVLAIALPPVAPARAQAPAAAIGDIRVDASELRARGAGYYADVVEATLPGALARAFADRRARGGATLVVRIDHAFLPSYFGPESGDGFFRAPAPMDDLSGEALLVVGREVVARTPLRVAMPADQEGGWWLPDHGDRRLVGLAHAFAGWLARRI